MNNLKLETWGVQTMSTSEMKNKYGSCHDDDQLYSLFLELAELDPIKDEKRVRGVLARFSKRYDEVCLN